MAGEGQSSQGITHSGYGPDSESEDVIDQPQSQQASASMSSPCIAEDPLAEPADVPNFSCAGGESSEEVFTQKSSVSTTKFSFRKKQRHEDKLPLTLDYIAENLKAIDEDGEGSNKHYLDYKRMLVAICIWLESKQKDCSTWGSLFGKTARQGFGQWVEVKYDYWMSRKFDESDSFMRNYKDLIQQVQKEKKILQFDFNKNWFHKVNDNIGRYFDNKCYENISSAVVAKIHAALIGNGICTSPLPHEIKLRAEEYISTRPRWQNNLQLPKFLNVLSFTNGTTYDDQGPLDEQGSAYLVGKKRGLHGTNKGGRPSKRRRSEPKSADVSFGKMDENRLPVAKKRVSLTPNVSLIEDGNASYEEEAEEVEQCEVEERILPLLRPSSELQKELLQAEHLLETKECEREDHLEKVGKLERDIAEHKQTVAVLGKELKLSMVSEEADQYFATEFGELQGKAIVGQIKRALINFKEEKNGGQLLRQICDIIGEDFSKVEASLLNHQLPNGSCNDDEMVVDEEKIEVDSQHRQNSDAMDCSDDFLRGNLNGDVDPATGNEESETNKTNGNEHFVVEEDKVAESEKLSGSVSATASLTEKCDANGTNETTGSGDNDADGQDVENTSGTADNSKEGESTASMETNSVTSGEADNMHIDEEAKVAHE